MKIEMKKGYAETVCNILRQSAYCQRNVLRPIAVKVGDVSNVLAMGPLVLEDSIEFTTHLISFNFVPIKELKDGEIIEVTTLCTGGAKLKDLVGENIAVHNASLEEEMLHFVDGVNPTEMKVTVYYRYSNGNYSIEENTHLLAGYLNSGPTSTIDRAIVVLNSRHNDIQSFGFEINHDSLDKDIIKFNITTKNGIDAKRVIKEAIDNLTATLNDIKGAL